MGEDSRRYESVLAGRYAGRAMSENWSEHRKFSLWRRLWVELARAQMELGLAIRKEQVRAMEAAVEKIDLARAAEIERRTRHDVMAHIHAFEEAAPEAKGIIHLGATSCFVADNAELIQIREGLAILRGAVVNVIDRLARFAKQHRSLVTLGFTHFQPAQCVTVGKRATLWIQDLLLDLDAIEFALGHVRFRGVKGTTGTQASFLALFGGDHEKVKALERKVARRFGFRDSFPVTGQTYPRKVDYLALSALSGAAQSVHKFASDVRLLSNLREVEEPVEAEQVGSSAMAYKRNPMRCERMTALARFVMTLSENAAFTAGSQWLERTLDDSANRRIVLPEAFLSTDAILALYANVTGGLVVNEAMIRKHVEEELPFQATEPLLLAAASAGKDRQVVHEAIRKASRLAGEAIRKGKPNPLLALLAKEPALKGVDVRKVMEKANFVGRAPEQVDEFLAEEVEPVLIRHRDLIGDTEEIRL
ncbi:MAG: adenylosuccinate lyase [Planctomycetota bacterium]